MKKFILPSVSMLLLGAAIVVVNAEDPIFPEENFCQGTCMDQNAHFTSQGWQCEQAITNYVCENGPGTVNECTDCLVNPATENSNQPKCMCKIE